MTSQLLATSTSASSTGEQQPRHRRKNLSDYLAVAVLIGLFPVVHDLGTYLTAPYWLDESWVALAVRFPLSEVMQSTSSTPVGWTLLLWLVPDGDYLRVVPMAFQVLTLPAAYLLGRGLGWSRRGQAVLAGLACGAIVLLMPFQQIRHDLKQYTADAAVAIALLVLAAWTESGWSRRRLAVTVLAVPVGMLVSHTTAIMGACVFGGFVLVAAARRQWRRLGEAVVAGIAALVLIVTVYLSLSNRANTGGMKAFWAAYMPSPAQLPQYLVDNVHGLMPLFGMPGIILSALLVSGVLTIAVRGRPATAVAVVLLPLAMIVLGVAKIYPLLDNRTSYFLMTVVAAVAGIGMAGGALAVAELGRRVLGASRRLAVAAAFCALFVLLFAAVKIEWYRFDGSEPDVPAWTAIAMDDVRTPTNYVASNQRPGDVIVVNWLGRYGFAVYWHEGQVVRKPYPNTVGWVPELVNQPNVIFAGLDEKSISESLNRALDLAASNGPDARVWLIRNQVVPVESDHWRIALADYRVELVTGGAGQVATVARHQQ